MTTARSIAKLPALALVLASLTVPAHGRTILAVFAHPDDEIAVGSLLALYAAEGHDVYLVTITSGQIGGSNTDIPVGDALGAARESETRCSAAKLGIHPPFLLGFMDGDLADRKVTFPAVLEKLRQIIREVKPDVMVTFGPDGAYGHEDHRIASVLATEVFQEPYEAGAKPPSKLYYRALPQSRVEAEKGTRFDRYSPLRDEFVTTTIDASAYLEHVWQAMQCHATQWAPVERMRQMFEDRRRVLEGKVFLRLAMSTVGMPVGMETDIFDRIED